MTYYTARSNNGTYHEANGGRALCNQRMYISGSVDSKMVAKADAAMFCKKCFPHGKPEAA